MTEANVNTDLNVKTTPREADLTNQLWRICDEFRRMEKVYMRLNNQIKAWERGGIPDNDPVQVYLKAVRDEQWKEEISAREKGIERVVKQMAIYESFVVPRHGLGAKGVGLILGVLSGRDRIRTLDDFATPSKLIRWFALDVENGRATQQKGFDKDAGAIRGGAPWRKAYALYRLAYWPTRNKGCIYRPVYLERKRYESYRNEQRAYASEAARRLKEAPGASKDHKSYWKDGKLSPGDIDNRALRYTAKRILIDLWCVWHGKQPKTPLDLLGTN